MGKDLKDNRVLWLGIILALISLSAYGFIKTPLEFIIFGILIGLSENIIDTAREAGLGREVSNSSQPIEATVAVEFARSLGGVIAYIVLILTYLVFHSIWQPVMVLGALFIIPKAAYALKNIKAIT